MNRASVHWSVAILAQPKWKRHFLAERKRPVREITHAEDRALDEVESREFAELANSPSSWGSAAGICF